MWNKCGMSRNEKGLKEAIAEIKVCGKTFIKTSMFLEKLMSLTSS